MHSRIVGVDSVRRLFRLVMVLAMVLLIARRDDIIGFLRYVRVLPEVRVVITMYQGLLVTN